MYSDIRESLKTGDIVLFSGSGLVSNLIKLATGSKWSHVGMVLKLDEYDFVTLWESTTLNNRKDLLSGSYRKGVQLVQLSSRVDSYDGEVAIKQLDRPIPLANKKLTELRAKLKGRDYERSENELLKSVYDGMLGDNTQDLSSVFCSELVAEAYKTLGLLHNHPSNEFTPADFARMTELKNGYKLKSTFSIK